MRGIKAIFAFKMATIAVATLSIAGCVTTAESSENRWFAISADSTLTPWASCISGQAHKWLDDPVGNPDWVKLELAANETPSNARLFTEVLKDCRGLMTGPTWESMTDRQVTRLMANAFYHFKRVELNMLAARAEAIT